MDDADRAAELTAAELAAVTWHRVGARRAAPPASHCPASHCVDCGEPIPPARAAAVVTDRCVDCATTAEGRGR